MPKEEFTNPKLARRIFIVAGEASGDAIGAKLMRALNTLSPEPIVFDGVGGEKMIAEGLKSRFPMQDISLMGFAEIIPHIPRLLRLIRETANTILTTKPDIVITIDSPGFNTRLAQRLRNHTATAIPPLVHYVAPTVWAYKPKRAKKFARLFDHLFAILPFEPPYFTQEGLECTFVGHPSFEDALPAANDAILLKYNLHQHAPLLVLMPGSRKGELMRHVPIFETTIARLKESIPSLQTIWLPAQGMEDVIKTISNSAFLLADPADKTTICQFATAGLIKSGTSVVEVARTGLPMVVAYIVHPITAWIARQLIRIKYASLINVVLGREAIPERLQERCTPEALSEALLPLLTDEPARIKQQTAMAEAVTLLQGDAEKPASHRAAEIVLSLLAKH